jgi:hypothetical protein
MKHVRVYQITLFGWAETSVSEALDLDQYLPCSETGLSEQTASVPICTCLISRQTTM